MRKPSCAGQQKGFTLIELLIVVAIIAILAAIAVPNFLEAQTRSKVSRVKADMRSTATAIESYYVDWNKYPEAFAAAAGPGFSVDAASRTKNPRIVRLRGVTTPIAYITQVPQDVFSREETTVPGRTNADVRCLLYADRATYARFVPNALDPTASTTGATYRVLWGEQYISGGWLLRSDGPVGGAGALASLGQGPEVPAVNGSVDKRDAYDPSNGTISTGNVFMMGPGIGFMDGK